MVSTKRLANIDEKRSYLKNIIKGQGTKMFGIQFRKKDGVLRTMSAQKGVARYVKGVGLNRELGPHEDIVFDTNAPARSRETKGDYRTVNLDTTRYIKSAGVSRKFKHQSDGSVIVVITE